MNETPYLLSETTSDVERKPALGQVAIVLAGLALGIMLLGIQLWLLTIALDRYLAGQGMDIWALVIFSGLVFLGGLSMLRLLARHPHFTPRPGG
jgi:cytochrome c biogenesis protein CcdA